MEVLLKMKRKKFLILTTIIPLPCLYKNRLITQCYHIARAQHNDITSRLLTKFFFYDEVNSISHRTLYLFR